LEQSLNHVGFERRRRFRVKRRTQGARGTADRLQLTPKCAAVSAHGEMEADAEPTRERRTRQITR
jgi:hypothetical protein